MKGSRGFTIVELIVIMAVTVFVLAATTQVLISIVTTFKQQSKIAETSIESVVGFEIIRRDIQSAGFGLATGRKKGTTTEYSEKNFSGLLNYREAVSDPGRFVNPAGNLNDATSRPPRAFAITSIPTGTAFEDSDYLVIKSANIGLTPASGKYHTLNFNDEKNTWVPALADPVLDPNLQPDDLVIVISVSDENNIGLVEDRVTSGRFFTKFQYTSNFTPDNDDEVRLVFGIDSVSPPRAPFNRADYYISTMDNKVPSLCAPETGVLVKAVMSHADGRFPTELPILDCVADFQVLFGLDETDPPDGAVDRMTDSLTTTSGTDLTAAQIRDQVKEVQIFVLAQEGQMDRRREFVPDFDNPTVTTLPVGNRAFDLTKITKGGEEVWKYYQWRVYKITESPAALR